MNPSFGKFVDPSLKLKSLNLTSFPFLVGGGLGRERDHLVLHVGKIIQFMVVTMHSLFLSCLCMFVIVSSIHNLWDLMGLSLRLDGNMTLNVQRSLCILVL
jgi:hypothetical protein